MIQKESTFKRGGGEQQIQQSSNSNQQKTIRNLVRNILQQASRAQIIYLLAFLIIEGVFFLRRGLQSDSQDGIQIACGIYLIALSSTWTFLLIYFPQFKKKFFTPSSSLFIATSSVSMKLQIDEHNSEKMHNPEKDQISQFQSKDHILNLENHIGQGKSEGFDSQMKSNRNNEQQFPKIEQTTSKHHIMIQVLQNFGIIISSSTAIVIMHEQFLKALSNEDDSMQLQSFQSIVTIIILLKSSALKLQSRMVYVVYIAIVLGYLLIRSSIHTGFQAESCCLSIIIYLQQITQPFLKQRKNKNNKNSTGADTFDQNKNTFNNVHQNQIFSPKNNIKQQHQDQLQSQQQQQQPLQQQLTNDFPILNKQIHYYRKNHTAQIIMQHQSPSSFPKNSEACFSKNPLQVSKRNNLLLTNHSRTPQLQSIQDLYLEPSKISELNPMVQSQNLKHKDSDGSTNSLMRLVTVDQKINKLNLGGFYAQLIGLIPVGIAIINNSNQLLYASSQLLQMLDCKDEQKALKILLTLSTNSQKAPYFAKEQSQGQENQGNDQQPQQQHSNHNETDNYRIDAGRDENGVEQQDISYLSSHCYQSKNPSSGGVLQQEGNLIKFAASGLMNISKPNSDLFADQSPVTLSSRNVTNQNNYQNTNNSTSNHNNFKEAMLKHESNHNQMKYSSTTQLLQSQQMHPLSNGMSFTKFNGSMQIPQNLAVDDDRSSRCFLQNGEDLEDEGQRSRRMSASISAQTLHPPMQTTHSYSKGLLGKDDGASEYGTDRNQYQGTSSAQISPRILNTTPISGGMYVSGKKNRLKTGLLFQEETEDTLGQSSVIIRKQSLTALPEKDHDSAKSIIEEEENAQSGSIAEPNGIISEMQFLPIEKYNNYSSPVTIGRRTQRNTSMQKSIRNTSNYNNQYMNDTFSENKSEIIQKDESVLNILNTMFGGGNSISDNAPRPSFTRMKSSKKINQQHANFIPQLSHFSMDPDLNNYGSPRLQQQFVNQPQGAAAHQQDINTTKNQGEDSNTSKQPTHQETTTKGDKPQDFEDILKQNTKFGYFQQDGNISIMQIEYLGCQYVLKIIINEVRVGENGGLQKVAIMVMEKMWQDFLVKRVEDMIQQKMQLFGSLSHELRTPLNCSISMMEVLHNITSSLDQQTQNMMDKYIQPALNSNKLLLNMINDILDFVQLENGSFKFGLIEFDLYALLKECISLVSIQASMKKLTVACYYDPQTPRIIKSDPNRIRQVILNFLSNSLKFTLQGHIILFASAHKSISEVTIGVKDTGIGINQDNIHEIFKAFNKVDLGEKSKLNMQGCGVGLALSNSIAKALGPDSGSERGITVESAKNEGSTFSFLVKNLKAEYDNNKEEDIYENSDISNEHLLANSTHIKHRVTEVFQPSPKDYSAQDSLPTQYSRKHPPRQPSQSSPKCAAGTIRKKRTTQGSNQAQPKLAGDQVNSSAEDSHFNNNNNTNNLASSNNWNNINNSAGYIERKGRSVSVSHVSTSQKKSVIFSIHTQDLNQDGMQIQTIGGVSYPLSAKNNANNSNSTNINNLLNNLNNIRTSSILESFKSKEIQDMKLIEHSKVEYPDGFNSYMEQNSPDCVQRSLESIQNDILTYACSCTQILVVDDQEFNLFSLTELLKQFYGIFSDTALNHEQVLKRISSRLLSKCCKTYKIIFMDINMPNKNGYQVAKMIKKYYNNPQNSSLSLPASIIIACSAYNGEEDKLKALAAGMTDFVTKPIMKKDLDTIISKYYEVQQDCQSDKTPK